MNIQTHVKNARIGRIVGEFVELKFHDFVVFSLGCFLTSLQPYSIVVPRSKPSRIVRDKTIAKCRRRLIRCSFLFVCCRALIWLGVRLAASAGAVVDPCERRWDGKRPLSNALVAADNDECELVLKRGLWKFDVCVCCIDKNETQPDRFVLPFLLSNAKI